MFTRYVGQQALSLAGNTLINVLITPEIVSLLQRKMTTL